MINPIYRHTINIRKESTNLLNPVTVTDGYVVSQNSGQLLANANYGATDFIPVTPVTVYAGLNTKNAAQVFRQVCFYDYNKDFISGVDGWINSSFTTPSGCYYVRMTIPNSNYNPIYSYDEIGLFRNATPTWEYFETYISKEANPVYKDDVALEYELENNQRFYRTKMSGKLTFIRDDYDFVANADFDTEFIYMLYKSDDFGQTWYRYYHGKFMKTDCKWDEDDWQFEVQPEPLDNYTDVIGGLEKEYDLIKLAPKIEPLVLQRRPVIQIYIPGDNVVSCFLGGTYWEQDANEVWDQNALRNTYYFALCNALKEINLTVSGTPAAASGLYTGRLSITNDGSSNLLSGTLRSNTVTGYYLDVQQFVIMPGWMTVYGLRCKLIRESDGAIMHEFSQDSASEQYDNLDFTMTAVSGTGTAQAEMATYKIYARYLLDVDSIQGLTTYDIPNDDIVENNRNYRRVIGYAIDVAFISQNFSDAPTEWGLADNNKYFMPPYSIWGQKFFPIARSTWRYASIWFGFTTFDWILEEAGRKRYLLRDTFPISACIKVLLQQFAPGITHEETPEYSQFLYSPEDYNQVYAQRVRLMITQKSNVLVGNYDQPAQKVPATLGQFTNMLRDCFRCFWFIDNGKFRIEHITWFRNGGTYTGTPQIAADLTQMENIRNGKKWGFHSSAWEYDKADLAERYQFAWMDDVTASFEGVPMQVLSKYVQPGKIEDVNVSNFTTDIDYLLLNPGDVSKDGFALFGAVRGNALVLPDSYGPGSSGNNGLSTPKYELKSEFRGRAATARFQAYSTGGATGQVVFYNGDTVISTQGSFSIGSSSNLSIAVNIPANATHVGFTVVGEASFMFYDLDTPSLYELPFVTRSMDGVDFIMQNGYMSWITLQPNYYVYDLPAKRVQINGGEIWAQGIERKKKQNVQFPSIADIDPMKLIKTYIGSGQIDKISVNLHSRMNKITVKYDTE